jgi:hypothetical protein
VPVFRRFALITITLSVWAVATNACGGPNKGTANNAGAGLSDAIERRDAGALVAGLGGDATDAAARAAADTLLRSLPKGTTMRLAGTTTTDRVTYEVTVPGSAPRQVSFVQITTGDGQLVLLPAETGP